MARQSAVSDEALARALGVYAGMVDKVVSDPERWLGLDDGTEAPPSSLPGRLLDAVKDRTWGTVTPASPEWAERPVAERVDWWVDRIGVSAGLAAAAPRVAGALSDRLPLQAALGASAAGLAVCAVAREHGVLGPRAWVPLLATVLFDRDLPAADAPVPSPEESESRLEADGGDERPAWSASSRAARRRPRGRCGGCPASSSSCSTCWTSGRAAGSSPGSWGSSPSSGWPAAGSTSAGASARPREETEALLA